MMPPNIKTTIVKSTDSTESTESTDSTEPDVRLRLKDITLPT